MRYLRQRVKIYFMEPQSDCSALAPVVWEQLTSQERIQRTIQRIQTVPILQALHTQVCNPLSGWTIVSDKETTAYCDVANKKIYIPTKKTKEGHVLKQIICELVNASRSKSCISIFINDTYKTDSEYADAMEHVDYESAKICAQLIQQAHTETHDLETKEMLTLRNPSSFSYMLIFNLAVSEEHKLRLYLQHMKKTGHTDLYKSAFQIQRIFASTLQMLIRVQIKLAQEMVLPHLREQSVMNNITKRFTTFYNETPPPPVGVIYDMEKFNESLAHYIHAVNALPDITSLISRAQNLIACCNATKH